MNVQHAPLTDAQTPEQLVNALRDAAERFAQDSADMDATAFLEGGIWSRIAQELDRASDRIVKQCAKVGYPYRNAR